MPSLPFPELESLSNVHWNSDRHVGVDGIVGNRSRLGVATRSDYKQLPAAIILAVTRRKCMINSPLM